jgi:23S rRNA (cytidine1920-2'-O)/16S rRNA (cytidine1409-2'-O)-methyltransferase
VGDLSFISLELVLPALAACTKPEGMMLPMVKPQFEVGKGQVGAGGVVADPAQRAAAVWNVIEKAGQLGWTTTAVAASPLPGPKGNVEFFCRMVTEGEPIDRAGVDAACGVPG